MRDTEERVGWSWAGVILLWFLIVGSISMSLALGRAGAQILWVCLQPQVTRFVAWLYGM